MSVFGSVRITEVEISFSGTKQAVRNIEVSLIHVAVRKEVPEVHVA